MSYIGNQVTSVPFTTDVFSGTGSATQFGPLVRVPATAASVMIFVAGVYQRPTIDYTLSADYVNFTSAPASSTNNIVVHHIGNGVMATQVPADGAVSTAKLADGSVTLAKFSSSANNKIASSGIVGSIVFGG
jgi:hypothetical protein